MNLGLRGRRFRIAVLPVLATIALACESTSTIVSINDVAVDLTITLEGPTTGSLEALELTEGETASLAAFATNALGLTVGSVAVGWSSSDSAVATVDSNGVVTALAAGSAVIYASADVVVAELPVRVAAAEQVPPPAPAA
ncbi:MAG: Ig-like domain-containing protein [Gemmatimonadota bacterium]|nr:Ig-like domain-containing protein [Gemmatimonadota bacterium]MDH3421815.1 Ig-like domain-containing protein [Gemmatimonadota bacterium]